MRSKLHTATVLFLSLCLSSTGFGQPDAEPEPEVPIEEGDIGDEGDEVVPSEGDEVEPVEETPGAEQAPPEQAPKQAPPAEAPPEEVPSDEFFAEDGGEDPSRPPAAGKGAVWGVVTDSNGEPVLEGPVQVIGTKTQVITDFDGQYRLELPPGKYSLRFFYEFHQPLRVDITVAAGEVNQVDAALKADEEQEIEEFVVEEKLEEASLESQILKRQQSASASDGITRKEISKTPDSNAASAAQRVVGANIVDGRFVYVRGLGERYSNSLLFGAPLPSPEPDRAAVPLDLFPALVLDSVNIAKTFTPDMPGDFAGGSVQIETRGVPEQFVFNVSLSGAYNTQATFRDRLDYAGGDTDWLAFDNGDREMPDLPDFVLGPGRKPNGDLVQPDELVGPGRDINGPMSARESFTPPDHGASLVVGNGWLLEGDQKLGVLASINYKREYSRIGREILKEYEGNASDERGFEESLNFEVERGKAEVDWGTFASVAYKPTPEHELRLMGLHTQAATDSTNKYLGVDDNTSRRVVATQLDWVQRGLTLGQLSGRHTLEPLNDAELGWDMTLARATRYQPDRRDVVYDQSPDRMSWSYRDGAESGRHFWADQHEDSFNAKLDYTQPIVDAAKIKLGGLSARKDRHFEARRFSFREQPGANASCTSAEYRLECPDELFLDENIDDILRLEEGSKEGDVYDARLNVYAGYLMGDVEFSEKLRAIVGGRVEHTDQGIEPISRFGEKLTIDGADLKVTNFLPSVGVVIGAARNSKARIGYSRTLARPQLRELAPFSFSDYFGGRNVNGEPDLVLTRINNFDMRFEHFPTLREVLAFSFFFKTFTDPIEPLLVSQGGDSLLTFRNAPSANLLGIELEARKDLKSLAPALKPFQVVTNLTLTHSRTEVGEIESSTYLTSKSRPLVNQAPWVFNLSLDYENEVGTTARALYNVSGKKLVEVGADGVPDAYEHPEHRVDFVAAQKFIENWQVKFKATNILNAETLITQGEENQAGDQNTVRRYREGAVLSIGLSYTM